MRPELTNHQRLYLGLRPVEPHWQQAEWLPDTVFYYDERAIRKIISYAPSIRTEWFKEVDYDIELTSEGLMLTASGRGKPRLITEANLLKYWPTGCDFRYDGDSGFWCTGPRDRFFLLKSHGEFGNWAVVTKWLNSYVASLPAELPQQLAERCRTPVPIIPFTPGDIVAFTLSNGAGYGFCRVLLDTQRLRRAGWIKDPPEHVGSFHYLKRIVAPLVIAEVLQIRKTVPALSAGEIAGAERGVPMLLSSSSIVDGCLPIVAHQPVQAEHLSRLPQALEELYSNGPHGELFQWGLVTVVIPPDEQLMHYLKLATQEFPRRIRPLADFRAEGMFYRPEQYFKALEQEEYELHDLRHSRYAELRRLLFQRLGLPPEISYDAFSRHFGYPTRQEMLEIQARMPFAKPIWL